MTVLFARLGDLAEQIRGVTYGKEDASKTPITGYLPVLRAGNITDSGLVFKDLVYVPEARVATRQRIKKGDIVIAASSGSLDIVGKAAPALDAFDGGFGAFCKVIRPNNKIDAGYLAQFFKTPSYRRTISSLAAGANINNLKSEHLDDLRVPLPPLPEQRRIAAILDQADALRAKRREALAQLDSLGLSIFVEMFGDPVANPFGIRTATLKSLAEISTGSTPSRETDGYFGGHIPWVKTTEVAGEPICFTEEHLTDAGLQAIRGKLHPPGSIVVAMYGQGQTRGRIGLLQIAACCNQACGVIRPSLHFDPVFMFCQLRYAYERLRALGRGGNQENLNLQILGAFEVLVPNREKQQTFATRIQAIECLKTTHRAALAELGALFASIQHRAFSGQLA